MASYFTYDQLTGFGWRPCSELGTGSDEPPAIAPVTNDLVLNYDSTGGTLTRWDVIVLVNADGSSSTTVTLPLALAGVVGMRATIVNVGSKPVVVWTSDPLSTYEFPAIMPGQTAIFAPTNHGVVSRILGPPAKSGTFAVNGNGLAFAPNGDTLTAIEDWTIGTNPGDCFDGRTFTVPRAGFYAVSASVAATSESALWQGGETVRLCVVKNGYVAHNALWVCPYGCTALVAPVSVSTTVQCRPGDEIWIALRVSRADGLTKLGGEESDNTLAISEL